MTQDSEEYYGSFLTLEKMPMIYSRINITSELHTFPTTVRSISHT
jgi:hypothetical protein